MALLRPAIDFFKDVPVWEFLGGTRWAPNDSGNPDFGVWPLVSATLVITVVALVVAIPLGLGYWWMLWDPEKQCWHDKFATDYVVPESAYPIR